jgi:flagellar hook assembly protein FlgD
MISVLVVLISILVSLSATAQAQVRKASEIEQPTLISTSIPVWVVDRPWYRMSSPEGGLSASQTRSTRPPEDHSMPRVEGENVTAVSLHLDNDFTAPDAITIVGGLQNTGSSTLDTIVVRFTLGHPQQGGIQIGTDHHIDSLEPGSTVYDSVSWSGFDGTSRIYFLVDVGETIAEVDESDNTDSLTVGMVDRVPWVWQEVNGYCHYAGQSMLFNFHGADHTVYETLELASCPYSVCYQDDWLGLMGGWGVCQGFGDIEYAGQLRNLSTELDIGPSWSSYLTQLHMRIDAGVPFETSVDPYYLPQPDYDICRTYDLHSGHAVVVVGYSDDVVIFNDPGVGLDLILEPPIPNPENRGANVIASLEAFRNAVESTHGSPYLLLSYIPFGPIPGREQMLREVLPRSIDRLDGLVGIYESGLTLYYDIFGAPCFSFLREDATATTFEAVFDAAMTQMGGDLEAALNVLAGGLDLWGCGICWDAAAVFYGSQSYTQAPQLSALSSRLSSYGNQAGDEYIDLLESLYYNGGNTEIAGPYLSRMQSALDQIMALEDSIRIELIGLVGSLTGVKTEDAVGQLPCRPRLACYPNPFNGRTVLRFELPEVGSVRLAIYNILGQQVRVLVDGHRPAGAHRVEWNGRDDRGQQAASGLYFCRMENDGVIITAKMLLVR